MLDFLEFEEIVGRTWHRIIGEPASYPRHPTAAIALEEVRGMLAVFFRGLGGHATVQIAATTARGSQHRLTLRQRIGMTEERLTRPGRDGDTVFLPPVIDVFASPDLNRDLYLWLAAFFAHLPCRTELPHDPLQRDLATIADACAATALVLDAAPGLRRTHEALCQATLAVRPQRRLPPFEARIEELVRAVLQGGSAVAPDLPPPRSYKSFLPVPLWGEAVDVGLSRRGEEDERGGGGADPADATKRKARRRETDQVQRDDSLALNRFEKILGLAEMINLNRDVDDDEEEEARKAADDLDEISVGKHQRKPATKLRFDLDLPPEAVDPAAITGEQLYPEWDYRRGAYRKNFCRVLGGIASEQGEVWTPDDRTAGRIRLVRRQFEALRPKHVVLRGQVDGNDLDLEALVRARCDLKASGVGSDRIHLATRKEARDLAVAVLVDVSLSTDAWIQDRRVLDVEKEALTVLAHGIAACGDDNAVFTFTSRKRDWVRVDLVKGFDEPMSDAVCRRIGALKPGFYTRIGAAVRHTAAKLQERPNKHRLLIVLTDGKPNDVDHYEGRYGIEDTRKAVQEARRNGVSVFGVTIDREAKSYFPTLFGRGGYAIVPHVARLPVALPAIYRQLVA